jgi:uncharacterized protein involved in cysteine biosynthesis
MRPGSTHSKYLSPATSCATLTRVQGIWYWFSHPAFWPLFKARLIPITLLSTFVITNLFVWTFLPQVAILAIWHGRAAWFNGVFLVLGEGAAIIAILFEAFFVDETMVDVFDAIFINEGLGDLVGPARTIHPDAQNSVKALGKPTISAIYAPFSLRQILEFVVLLPLNLIPIIGVPIFLVLTGYRAGPFQHWRYFKLLGLSKKERREYIKKRQMKYTWFGTVHLLLQLVPVLSMLFLLTTAAGSALWAVKMEKARRSREAEHEASPEPYEDTPV